MAWLYGLKRRYVNVTLEQQKRGKEINKTKDDKKLRKLSTTFTPRIRAYISTKLSVIHAFIALICLLNLYFITHIINTIQMATIK